MTGDDRTATVFHERDRTDEMKRWKILMYPSCSEGFKISNKY